MPYKSLAIAMAVIGSQAVNLEHPRVGGDPCTYAPQIVNGEMTWPGCERKNIGSDPHTWGPPLHHGQHVHDALKRRPAIEREDHRREDHHGKEDHRREDHHGREDHRSDHHHDDKKDIVGNDPCTWGPDYCKDGKCYWKDCPKNNGLAQVDHFFTPRDEHFAAGWTEDVGEHIAKNCLDRELGK